MKKVALFLLITAMLCSCGGNIVQTEIPWNDEKCDACDVYRGYLDALASGDSVKAFTFEDQFLWPSLDKDAYIKLRNSRPEFNSLLSKSKVIFIESTLQKDWSVYGKTYDLAHMFSFKVETPTDVTDKEKPIALVLKDKVFTTVGVIISDKWKFLPAFGPEVYDLDQATKSYNTYIEIIKKGEFSKIFDYTPADARVGATPKSIEEEWKVQAKELPELTKVLDPKVMLSRITFMPLNGQYRWGVLLEVTCDYEAAQAIKNQTEQTKVILQDYQQGATSVLMVPEEIWKPVTLNPLFGSPGQDQSQ